MLCMVWTEVYSYRKQGDYQSFSAYKMEIAQ